MPNGKKFRQDRHALPPQPFGKRAGGGGGTQSGFHSQMQQLQQSMASLQKQLLNPSKPKGNGAKQQQWTQQQWDEYRAQKPHPRRSPPPLSWINDGWQDYSYAAAARRADGPSASGGGTRGTSVGDASTTAAAERATALQEANEARDRARRVKSSGDCSEEEIKRLEDLAEEKRRVVWEDHTDLSARLKKLDQKAGALYHKIQKHPLILKEKDDAVEAAKEVLARKAQERLDYASYLTTWREALEEAKADIEQCKAAMQAEQAQDKPREAAKPPVQSEEGEVHSPLLTGLLAQLLEAVGNVNPQAAQISSQIRALVEQSGTAPRGEAATESEPNKGQQAPQPAQGSKAKDEDGDDIMLDGSTTAQPRSPQHDLDEKLKLVEQQRLEEEAEAAREELRANQSTADKRAKTNEEPPASVEALSKAGDDP